MNIPRLRPFLPHLAAATIAAMAVTPAFAADAAKPADAAKSAKVANSFDGKTNLICSVTDVLACTETARCIQGQARVFDVPQFIGIDFAKKQVHSTKESGSAANSAIKNQEVTRNQLILQGIENGHGWTVAIDNKHGRMTTSAVGEDATYIMFGACIAR